MRYCVELSEAGDILQLYRMADGYAPPPESAVEVTDGLGELLAREGFAHKRLVGGELQNAPPLPPPLDAWRRETLARARALRLPIMQILDGMQASAMFTGATIVVDQEAVPLAGVIEDCKQALKDLPTTVNLSQCTTQQQMEAVVLLAYKAIVDAAPPEIKSAFDSLKP